MSDDSLRALINPTSIAVVGASSDPSRISGRPLRYLLQHGFEGRLEVVNPNRASVQGLPAHNSVETIPEPCDIALITVPAGGVEPILADCATAGIKVAILFSAVPDGLVPSITQAIAREKARTGMRVLGPNCAGVVNFETDLPLAFSADICERQAYLTGSTAIISQSGGIMASVFSQGQANGVGFAYAVGTGNEADLSVEDFVEFAALDPQISQILLFAETFRKPQKFLAAAELAYSFGKPLVLLKGGRSSRGQLAAASHTGAMVGQGAHERAFFDALGVVSVDDVSELWKQAQLRPDTSRSGGSGIGILSGSGGAGVIAADLCAQHELTVPDISYESRERILAVFDGAHVQNPVDVTAKAIEAPQIWYEALASLLNDPAISGVVAKLSKTGRDAEIAEITAQLASSCAKPVVVAWLSDTDDQESGYFHLLGGPVSVYPSLLEGVKALATRLGSVPMDGPRPWLEGELRSEDGPRSQYAWDEASTRDWLDAIGIPQAAGEAATMEDDLRPAFHRLESRVMLKLSHRALPHRSDVGAVEGPLQGLAELREALERLRLLATRLEVPDARLVVVEYVERVGPELLVGVRNDFQFGPVIVVGVGGTMTEVIGQVVSRPAPVTHAQAGQMLDALPSWGTLSRPLEPDDVTALAGFVARVSEAAWDHRFDLEELDLNPVVICRRRGPIALDGLMVTRQRETGGLPDSLKDGVEPQQTVPPLDVTHP